MDPVRFISESQTGHTVSLYLSLVCFDWPQFIPLCKCVSECSHHTTHIQAALSLLHHRATCCKVLLPEGFALPGSGCETPITLKSFSANLKCVWVWVSMHSAVPGAANKAPLSTHCHSLLRTHTHVLHAVFIGLNDRGDSFPCGKRGGTSCQHGPLHLPSHKRHTHMHKHQRSKLETERKVEVAKWNAHKERLKDKDSICRK